MISLTSFSSSGSFNSFLHFDEKLLDETLEMGDKNYFYFIVAIVNFLDLNSLLQVNWLKMLGFNGSQCQCLGCVAYDVGNFNII
jgi:hypothetical protein